MAETSKPTLVRIKRKRCDESVDHLWLEQNASKRLVDVSKLSLNDKSESSDHGRVLFRRFQTVPVTQAKDGSLAQSLLSELDERKNARRSTFKSLKTPKLTSKQQHERSSQRARYKQVWKNRRQQEDEDKMHECFRLYDVERTNEEEQRDIELLSKYKSLLQEYCPEIYADKEDGDEYVYDVYVQDDEGMSEEGEEEFVTLKVSDWDASPDGAQEGVDSADDSEDSNRENHPDNDYPDEEEEEDESSEDVEDMSSDEDEDEAPWKVPRRKRQN